MGAWGYFEPPTTPSEEYPEEHPLYWDCWDMEDEDVERFLDQESLDERAEQESVPVIPTEWTNEWGAWLEEGERPVPNTG